MTIELPEPTKPIKRGVNQKGVISRKLFILTLKEVFRALEWGNKLI